MKIYLGNCYHNALDLSLGKFSLVKITRSTVIRVCLCMTIYLGTIAIGLKILFSLKHFVTTNFLILQDTTWRDTD